jgi:hypothetical protein
MQTIEKGPQKRLRSTPAKPNPSFSDTLHSGTAMRRKLLVDLPRPRGLNH